MHDVDGPGMESEASLDTWISDEDADNGRHRNEQDQDDFDVEMAFADREYWEEERKADAWLARYPGVLYPNLFIVAADKTNGEVHSTRRSIDQPCHLLRLPIELRRLVYEHYLSVEDEGQHADEDFEPFPTSQNNLIGRILLDGGDLDFKHLLSTPLLRVSRQSRFEALPVLLGSSVFTIEWLEVLPRFVHFLGPQGLAMVRYLGLWDFYDLSGVHRQKHHALMTNLTAFPGLKHLRIVLCTPWGSAARAFFDSNDIIPSLLKIKEGAKPRMKPNETQAQYLGFYILEEVSAHSFTMAWDELTPEEPAASRYWEFEQEYGPFYGLKKRMRDNYELTGETAEDSTMVFSSERTPQATQINDEQISPPRTRSHVWQETDALSNKTVPMYNFLRDLVLETKDNIPPDFTCFPRATLSHGAIMRDCPICYLVGDHCGNHSVPNHFDEEIHAEMFAKLSYVEMRESAHQLVNAVVQQANVEDLKRVLIVQQHLGWLDVPGDAQLQGLDTAAAAGWEGKNIDKHEVKVWNMLYRAMLSFSRQRGW